MDKNSDRSRNNDWYADHIEVSIMRLFLIYLIVINLIGYFIMYADKQRAIQRKYRIPEKNLWVIALIGGAVGTTLGMNRFRHKTKHAAFRIGFPILAMLQVILFLWIIVVEPYRF